MIGRGGGGGGRIDGRYWGIGTSGDGEELEGRESDAGGFWVGLGWVGLQAHESVQGVRLLANGIVDLGVAGPPSLEKLFPGRFLLAYFIWVDYILLKLGWLGASSNEPARIPTSSRTLGCSSPHCVWKPSFFIASNSPLWTEMDRVADGEYCVSFVRVVRSLCFTAFTRTSVPPPTDWTGMYSQTCTRQRKQCSFQFSSYFLEGRWMIRGESACGNTSADIAGHEMAKGLSIDHWLVGEPLLFRGGRDVAGAGDACSCSVDYLKVPYP